MADGGAPENLEQRILFLDTNYGSMHIRAEDYLREQDERLAELTGVNHSGHCPDVVLWFEHDLFDHVILLYLINWLADHGFETGDRVRLIQIDRHASIQPPQLFRGLGQLTPDDIVALYNETGGQQLTAEHWQSARIAWEAWLDSSPEKIAKIAAAHDEWATPGLPFLATAFARHLREFPAVNTGLNETERMILEAVQIEATTVPGLFSYFNGRDSLLGLGDLMFWPRITGMAFVEQPLIRCEFSGRALISAAEFYEQCWSGKREDLSAIQVFITDFGRSVLAGEADHIATNGIDCWRGGVHLKSPDNVWRWNSDSQRMITPAQ